MLLFVTATLVPLVAELSAAAICYKSVTNRVFRLLLATSLSLVVSYAAAFVVSGFGWGWPDASERFLLVLRICFGVSIGGATALFGGITWSTFSWRLGLMLVVANVAI